MGLGFRLEGSVSEPLKGGGGGGGHTRDYTGEYHRGHQGGYQESRLWPIWVYSR